MKNIFLLDIDETIFDFRRTEREALVTLLNGYQISVTGEMIERYHAINDSYWKKLERGEVTRAELVVDRFQDFFALYGWNISPKEASKRYFFHVAQGGFYLDGAETFVQELRRRGKIYLVTNGATITQTGRISVSGLKDYIEDVFISESIGIDKPSKRYAEYVEAHIPHYERARAIWIGDSLTSDAPCAASLGIDFIWYCPDGTKDGYDGIFAKNYDELLKIIDML